MEKATTSLNLPQPFDLRVTALSHGWHECAPMSWCEAGGCLQMIERIGRRVFRIGVTQARTNRSHVRLRLLVESERLDDAGLAEMRRRVGMAVRIEEDFAEFHALCAAHPPLAVLPVIGAGRCLRAYSMTENIIKALCGTNVTWLQAVKMINRIAQLGPHLPDHRNLNAWPTVEEILRAGRGYLLDVVRVGYRADSILEFCDRVGQGELDPQSFYGLARTESSDVLLKLLRSIKGIGPSSAHYLLSMLGHYDRISIDSATIAHVAAVHLRGRKPTPRQVENIYDRFGAWKQLVWWFEHWLSWDSARAILADKAD